MVVERFTDRRCHVLGFGLLQQLEGAFRIVLIETQAHHVDDRLVAEFVAGKTVAKLVVYGQCLVDLLLGRLVRSGWLQVLGCIMLIPDFIASACVASSQTSRLIK